MPTQAEILSDMLAALSLAEPELDTGIGSVPRKMYDPVAEAIAERDADAYLHQYAYDIDAKTGADLDEMVRLFGMSRLTSQRSSGEVLFSRSSPSANAVRIPAGTQVQTDPTDTPNVIVATVVQAVIPGGDTSVSVPCIALTGGTDGNVAASSLTFRKTPLQGVTSVTNLNSFTGGTDPEDDTHLRKRFRDTVLRSLAGTEQMFLGIALNDPNVTQANVVGSVKRWRERIEISSGTATSTVQDAAYIVPDSAMVGTDLTGGHILRESVHFEVDYGSNPPTVDSLDSTAMPDGIYDLEFEYVPLASRNDLANGITNRVDVYVKGTRAKSATATLVFKDTRQFNNTSSDPLYRQNFRRTVTDAVPTNGNFFVPFPLAPVIDPSTNDQLVIDGHTYLEGTHYWLVYDRTAKGNAPRSLAGVEIRSNANGSPLTDPSDDSRFNVTYVYNEVPRSIEASIGGTWRIMNQDVWVHEGQLLRLRLYFAVILQRGYSQEQVQSGLEAALSAHIDSIGFNNVLQASDLLQVAHNVAGVDAIRFLTDSDDGTHYAIQRVNATGTTVATYASGITPRRAKDVLCGDAETPVLDAVVLDVRAQNTWGSV